MMLCVLQDFQLVSRGQLQIRWASLIDLPDDQYSSDHCQSMLIRLVVVMMLADSMNLMRLQALSTTRSQKEGAIENETPIVFS